MSSHRRFIVIWAISCTILCIGLVCALVIIANDSNRYIGELQSQIEQDRQQQQQLSEDLAQLQSQFDLLQAGQTQLGLDFATSSAPGSIHSFSQAALQDGIAGTITKPNIPGIDSGIETVWSALNVLKWAYTEDALSHKYVSSNDVSSVINSTNNIINALEHYPDRWPTDGGVITSYFGYRADPFTNETKYHSGVDIAVNTGTNVYACGAGKVYYAGYDEGGYGYFIMIDHGNGLVSLYGHLSKIKVSTGQTVSKGQIIGLSGSSGRSTGPHLHAELRLNGTRVTPKFNH